MENFDYLCNDMEQYIQIRGQLVDLTTPRVMGILNVTPDSFYEGSRQQTEADIARRADQIVEEGGTMIDVGAFSTRPDATFVSEEEEMERLRTGLRIVRRCQPQAIVSVDTFRPMVARMAVEEYGADIINDVSEGGVTGIAGKRLTDRDGNGTSEVPAMFEMVARLGVPYVLMSVQPTLADTLISMSMKLQQLRELGVKDVVLDPGFGFGKTLEQNYRLLGELDKLKALGLPLLVGVSRKSMIYHVLGGTPATSLNGTTALHAIALMKGASILRVHDVKEAVEAVTLYGNVNGNGNENGNDNGNDNGN